VTANEWALFAAIGTMFLIHTVWSKIKNPSPPPPERDPETDDEQGKRTYDSTGPKGDVDHDDAGEWIPPEDPDHVTATRVGWYEDDPDRPGRTHIHWVSRAAWERGRADPDERLPRWRVWLGI